MKQHLIDLADEVCVAVQGFPRSSERRIARDRDGDPHFEIDELAEQVVRQRLDRWPMRVALFSEDRGLIEIHADPEWILIVDPIDGTRPAVAGLENCCFSAAVAPYSRDPKFGDICAAVVTELTTRAYFYADDEVWESSRPSMPSLSDQTALDSMFWSIELTAHPIRRLADVYGDMLDGSVTKGAVFVFTSSAYSLTRIISGQLDAHVDVGHAIIRREPSTIPEFERVGRGKVVTLYPYDIAGGAYLLERAGGCVTSALGESLANLPLLTDKSIAGQCSLVASSNPTLHQEILANLRWEGIKS